MNDLMKVLVAAGGVCLAVPAMAQDAATMTCADYMAMDADGQTAAMESLQAESMASGTAGTGTTGTTGTTSTTTTTADTGTTAGADADAMMEEQMTAMMAACEADPSMLAMDAMNADG